jgi:hypothetical protein
VYHFHKRSPWNTKGYTIYKAYQPIIKSFADEAAKEAQEAEEAKESGKKTPRRLSVLNFDERGW